MSESCERPTQKGTSQPLDVPTQELSTYKLEASQNGCTGMFFRKSPNMDDSINTKDWPRNGAILKGFEPQEHPGWVHLDNGYWMPIKQHGTVVCHKHE